MSQDRTEKPTARKLRDARKKGQVARSRDLGQAVALAAAVGVLAWVGSWMLWSLAVEVQKALERMGDRPLAMLEAGDITTLAVTGARTVVVLAGPVALASALAVVAVHSAQGGVVFAPEAMKMDWARLSPAQGLKKLGLSRGGIQLLKAALSATALGVVAYYVIKGTLAGSALLGRVEALQSWGLGWQQAERMLRQSTLVLLAFAAADYGVTRWQFTRSQRMTKQEVRDDHRLTEGSPETKARVRRIQREMFRKRMLRDVPKATVVVTNPTHYAVALEYRRPAMAAPRVVAKGQGLLAQRIKAIAREHGVPMVENVPLAQALYKHVEVGETIPAALFEAVAEVLAYLIRLRQLVL